MLLYLISFSPPINQVLEINVDKSQIIHALVYFLISDCPRGYFGMECAGKCSDKCHGCNHINGLCDSGCKPGWRGDYCHEGLFIFMGIT